MKCFAKNRKQAVSKLRRGDGRAREERRARNGGASGGGCGVARRARGASGRRCGRGAVLSAPNKKQGCRRQPCSLSMLDSIYLIQFVFFGSRGLLGRKVLEWGLGRSPIYNGSRSGHGAKPHKNLLPHVGVRGAQPRYAVFPAGRGAPPIPFPCGARIIYQAF